jgi:putative hydrolase of HD superfamily
MKLAVETCAPRPGRFGPTFAEPSTVSPSTATAVCPGGSSIHSGRAVASVSVCGYAYVSPAATMLAKNGQILGQSSAAADRMITFAPYPGIMSTDSLPVSPVQRQRLDFVLAAHELTAVSRVNRLLDGSRAETSAEHSWHLALTALAFAPELAPEVDLSRVVAMLLVHDLPEVEAGDVPIYDEQARLDIVAVEHAAAARLFARLPSPQDEELLALWHEFEQGETADARFAKAVDRLQPLLLHWASDGAAWAERGITVDQERRLMAVIGQYWPPLAPIAAALIDDAYQRGLLASEPREPSR